MCVRAGRLRAARRLTSSELSDRLVSARADLTRDGLSRSPGLSASHQVRPEEPDDESHDGESKIAVDVLSMVKEVSVNYLVDGDDNYHDQQPDAPVGNEMLPHGRQDPFRQSFRQALLLLVHRLTRRYDLRTHEHD